MEKCPHKNAVRLQNGWYCPDCGASFEPKPMIPVRPIPEPIEPKPKKPKKKKES